MDAVKTVLLAFVAAATVEAVWETLKMIWEQGKIKLDKVGPIALGLLVAFTLPVDIFAILGFPFATAVVGQVLTGILISRGSNWVHDWIKKAQAGGSVTT